MSIDLIDAPTVIARLSNLKPGEVAALGGLGVPGYIPAASRAVESYCHRTFGLTTWDERYDSAAMSGHLFLRNRPVVSITSIAVGTVSPVTVDPARYSFNPGTGEVVGVSGNGFYSLSGPWDFGDFGLWGFGGGFSSGLGFQDVHIVYQAGYATIPEDVSEACLVVIQALIQNARRNAHVMSETLGPHSISYANPNTLGLVTGLAADLLRPYVTFRFN